MSKEESLFNSIGEGIPEATKSKLFGKRCFKINGKAFICLFENEMVFKLTADSHSEALSMDGAQLFDPSRKNRPMKEWVQLPFTYQKKWEGFAKASLKYMMTKT